MVHRRDDEVVKSLRIGDAAHRPQSLFPHAGRHVSPGYVAILTHQRLGDPRDRDPIGIQAIRIHPDVDGAFQPAHNQHFSHAIRPLDLRLHEFVGQFGEFPYRSVARQGDRQYGRRFVVELRDNGRVNVGRQLPQHRGHPVPHVLRRRVDVAVQVKRGDDHRPVLHRHRAQFANPFHRVDSLFDDVGDQRLHLLRPRAGQNRPHGHRRHVHRRKPVHSQPEVTRGPHHHQRQDHHGRKDRSLNANFGEFLHYLLTIVTGRPPTKLPGFTTTSSPAFNPSVISTRPTSR